MKTNARLLLWTTGTSFIASLSLGSPNVRVAGFVFKHELKNAVVFCLAAVIMQMVMLRMVLTFIAKYNAIKRLSDILAVIAVGTMVILAARFLEVESDKSLFYSTPSTTGIPILISGAFYSLVSSIRAPSWLAWITILKCKHWFDSTAASYNYYTAAIGLGALLAFVAYGLAGFFLADHLLHYHHILNRITSILLIILAIKRLLMVFTPALLMHKK